MLYIYDMLNPMECICSPLKDNIKVLKKCLLKVHSHLSYMTIPIFYICLFLPVLCYILKKKFREFLLWYNRIIGVSAWPGHSRLKDLALLHLWQRFQLWLGSDHWPRNSICCETGQPKKKNKFRKTYSVLYLDILFFWNDF